MLTILCGVASGYSSDRLKSEPGVVSLGVGLGLAPHWCSLLSDGTVECWGGNRHGQLGDGTFERRWGHRRVRGLGPVRQLAVGGAHNCALLEAGTVSCWGKNWNGQLGDETHENRATPSIVHGLPKVTQIAAGDGHSCALARPKLWCWGLADDWGPVYRPRASRLRPVPVEVPPDVTQVVAGPFHTCVVTRTADVWCAGSNIAEQIAPWDVRPLRHPLMRARGSHRRRFVLVPELSPASQIGMGPTFTCAKLTSGATRCRGHGAPKPAVAAHLFRCGSIDAEVETWSQACMRPP
jgi:alpha-tubulin suppressor-like RCC1 family protein